MAPPEEGSTPPVTTGTMSESKPSNKKSESMSPSKPTPEAKATPPAEGTSNDEAYVYPEWYANINVHERSLEDQAGCISNWFLQYLSPLLRLGSTKVLVLDDIGAPSEQDRASRAFKLMREAWKVQCDKTALINNKRKAKYDAKLAKLSEAKRAKAKPFVPVDPSIAAALANSFGVHIIFISIFYYVLSALLQFLPVMILEDLVKYFETINTDFPHQTLVHPWFEVAGLGIFPFLTSILQTRSQTLFQHAAVFVRTAVSTVLYEKSLNVSAAARAATSTGQVVNMMSNDTTQLQRFIQFGGMTLVAPIQIVIALILIYRQVGQATWVGVGFMIVLAPVNVVVFFSSW